MCAPCDPSMMLQLFSSDCVSSACIFGLFLIYGSSPFLPPLSQLVSI
uniref:Uncharacterized protein n=1 Tax=Anguilla anguilla TaxID=7936 RepID=A0A0E9Q6X3_ANGAN